MVQTHFETFLHAIENTPEHEGVLGDDFLIFPPITDYGYDATPRNALIFATMGVDGVHYAILKIDGAISDDSPVIHVSPMDFDEPYAVLGACFLDYLATACGVSLQEMESVFGEERAGRATLVPFMTRHFDRQWLYDDARLRQLDGYLRHMELT